MRKLNLQQFSGSLTLTVKNDGNWSATTASPSSSLAEDDKSTLTLTANTGYELDEIEVIEGGATIENDNGTWKVKMGEANATIFVKGKKNNVYQIVEETPVWINGTSTLLKRNMKLVKGNNGAIVGVDVTGSEVTLNADVVAALVKSGAIIKL